MINWALKYRITSVIVIVWRSVNTRKLGRRKCVTLSGCRIIECHNMEVRLYVPFGLWAIPMPKSPNGLPNHTQHEATFLKCLTLHACKWCIKVCKYQCWIGIVFFFIPFRYLEWENFTSFGTNRVWVLEGICVFYIVQIFISCMDLHTLVQNVLVWIWCRDDIDPTNVFKYYKRFSHLEIPIGKYDSVFVWYYDFDTRM